MRLILFLLFFSSVPALAAPLKCPTVSGLTISKGEYAPRAGVVFLLEDYSARMVPQGKKVPQCMVKESEVQHGTVVVGSSSLTKLFDEKISQGGNSKISDLKVELKEDRVSISGKVHKGLPIPFTVEGPVDSPDGRVLRLHADKVKAIGIPIEGLMNALGMELGSLVNPGENKGVTAKGDDLYFAPEQIGHIRGHIRKVRVAHNQLTVEFGPAATQVARQSAEPRGKKP